MDALAQVLRQRHALEEEALVALQRQVLQADLATRADLRLHVGYVRLDVLVAERVGNRHPVVAVLDEVQLADPVDVDGRHCLALALGEVDALPALADPRGGGAEVAVELARAVDGPDDRVERDHLQPEAALADPPEGAGDLLEREDVVHVVDSTQPGGQSREGAPATGAAEVELSVGARQPGVPGHQSESTQGSSTTERARVVAFAAASAAKTVTRTRTPCPARSLRRASRGTATAMTV